MLYAGLWEVGLIAYQKLCELTHHSTVTYDHVLCGNSDLIRGLLRTR